jgi:hypothetical protein
MKGTNMLMTEDSRRADGLEDPPQCNYNGDAYVQGSTFPDCGSDPVVTLSDENPAPAGATLVINSTAIGQFVGPCLNNGNRPEGFCTEQEKYGINRGAPNTLPAVTGTASAEVTNIFLGDATSDGLAVCKCADGTVYDCPVLPTCDPGSHCCSGPLSIPGSPLPSCSQLLANPPNVSGLGLAGAFTALANPTIGDEAITDLLQAGTWSALATSISDTDTTLTLVDASSFPSSAEFGAIENEQISWTGKSGNQLTGVTRGFNSSAITAHSAGVTVVY